VSVLHVLIQLAAAVILSDTKAGGRMEL